MANSKSLIAEAKSAVNKAMYHPTKQKKALAIKLLKKQISEIEALKTVTPKKAKKKAINKVNDLMPQDLENAIKYLQEEASEHAKKAKTNPFPT